MQFIDRLTIALERFVNGVGRAAAWLALLLMVTIIFDVAQRSQQATIISSTKLQELEWHLHATLFLLCLGYAYLKDAHVRIELIRDRLAPRTRVWIELIGSILFVIPYCAILVYWGYEFAEFAWRLDEGSAQSGLSDRWIIKSMIPIGFALLLLSGLAVALKCILYLFGPPDLRDHAAFIAETHHAELIEAGEEPLKD